MTDGSAFRLLHVTKFTDKKDSRLVVLYVAKVSSILTVRCYKTIRRRQSARMSKITNDGLTQSGNIWHMTHMTTVGVKGRSSVRLVVFVCRVTDVWFFFLFEIFNSWPSTGSSVHFCRHYLLPHDTDMRLCKRGQRSCTATDSGVHSVRLVSLLYIMIDLL